MFLKGILFLNFLFLKNVVRGRETRQGCFRIVLHLSRKACLARQGAPLRGLVRFQIRTERFIGRQLGFLRLAVSSARNTRLEHAASAGSSNKRPQLPSWGPFLLSDNRRSTTILALRCRQGAIDPSVGGLFDALRTCKDQKSGSEQSRMERSLSSPESKKQL